MACEFVCPSCCYEFDEDALGECDGICPTDGRELVLVKGRKKKDPKVKEKQEKKEKKDKGPGRGRGSGRGGRIPVK